MLTQPYHRRTRPKPQHYVFSTDRIDLTHVHLDPYPKPDPSGVLPDLRPDANQLFDGRAAAGVFTAVGNPADVRVIPRTFDDGTALLNGKSYKDIVANIYIVNAKCLAAMAYGDYFPSSSFVTSLQSMVSQAIQEASPGWCGTFGPDITSERLIANNWSEGDYDFESQMFMLPLVYNFYDDLRPSGAFTKSDVQEQLITKLLALGRIRRLNLDDTETNRYAPNDWSKAGVFMGFTIPETENHVLTIATARYLTNQLLYQRNYKDPLNGVTFDNRRNSSPWLEIESCMNQVLDLLRNYLRDDFAEYNAKNYQEETRHALLNLCSYAYDAEVRLGARMVLDYISAHIAVSSNDLRRMVPFRRLSEGINVNQIPDDLEFMDVSLLDAHGADPMPAQFALLAGNTRAYQNSDKRDWHDGKDNRIWDWAITPNFGQELTLGALSCYRLPPSIHDLFVNDLHRRFFQRLHRYEMLEEPGGQRNCDNMEIYAGSPSYLITAGGKPAPWVIPGQAGHGYKDSNLGVAVPTSFMPTGLSAANFSSLQQLADSANMSARPISLKAVAGVFHIFVPFSLRELFKATVNTNNASDLIQISMFSNMPPEVHGHGGGQENYGVAPDFACGFNIHLPAWTGVPKGKDGVFFVDRKSQGGELAGFFLAIIKLHAGVLGDFILLEAFDTWHRGPDRPEVSFQDFQRHVRRDNPNIIQNNNIHINNGQKTVYKTFYGNNIEFVIWYTEGSINNPTLDNYYYGSKITNIEYGAGDPADTLKDAGNDTNQFLSGNILKSAGDGKVEIHNPSLGTQITLDWSDPSHLVRIAEDGEVEHAGRNGAGQLYEVWVDFDWNGPMEGDFYRPFNQLASAVAAVADGGVIKIAPGSTRVRGPILGGKRMKIVAPIGGVTIGAP